MGLAPISCSRVTSAYEISIVTRSTLSACAAALGFVLALAPAARAQETAITGLVTDTSDAVLPGVTVTAQMVETGNTFVGITDATGQYRIGPLRPGVYTLKAELSGFSTVAREGLEMLLGQRSVVNLKMSVATVQETVVVSGEAPLIDVSTTRFVATQGRSNASQVNAITKSGTNNYSGSLSGYFRDDKFIVADFVAGACAPVLGSASVGDLRRPDQER